MTAYYNEIDPVAAQWLRNLIAAGHIAAGEVDERSIVEVRPRDLQGFTQCHFFAGVGVWSESLRRAQWADDRPVWTGSCPCQPFSAAGGKTGFDDERHLWPDWYRLIRECRPVVVFGEQVADSDGLTWLDLVSTDLEGEAYTVGAVDSCAAGFGAPHVRQRLFFVAHPGRAGDEHGCRPRDASGAAWEAQGEARQRERGGSDLGHSGAACGLAYTEQRGREGGGQRRPESGAILPAADGLQGGLLGDTDSQRRDRLAIQLRERQPRSAVSEAAGPGPVTDGGAMPNGPGVGTGTGGRMVLNPSHSRWLMGLTAAWDECAPTETRSTLKSRASSSRRTST